jgi:hypothetical protein
MRESRDARRGLSYSQGTFDESDVNEEADLSPDDIVNGEAPPLAPDMPAAYERKVHDAPKGKTPSKVSRRKGKRTKARSQVSAAKSGRTAGSTAQEVNPKATSKPVRMNGDDLKTNDSKYWDED